MSQFLGEDAKEEDNETGTAGQEAVEREKVHLKERVS